MLKAKRPQTSLLISPRNLIFPHTSEGVARPHRSYLKFLSSLVYQRSGLSPGFPLLSSKLYQLSSIFPIMQLSLGISTCPNDTFIYEALVHGLENSPFEWKVTYADVQTLNEMVLRGELDVAKISAQVYPQIREAYRCLGCGGAIGYGCGPLLLSSSANAFDPELSTTLPGTNTTAALLFRFWYSRKFKNAPKLDYALFNEVYQRLLNKSAPQGVTIHEHRFTWKRDGLHLLQDLGAFWEQETGSPIPLGIAVAKKELGFAEIEAVEREIRRSLQMARQRKNPVTPFIVEKAQIDDEEVIKSHIAMFVNDFSENVGDAGWRALENLWRLSHC